jgi:hypothetical protein
MKLVETDLFRGPKRVDPAKVDVEAYNVASCYQVPKKANTKSEEL